MAARSPTTWPIIILKVWKTPHHLIFSSNINPLRWSPSTYKSKVSAPAATGRFSGPGPTEGQLHLPSWINFAEGTGTVIHRSPSRLYRRRNSHHMEGFFRTECLIERGRRF